MSGKIDLTMLKQYEDMLSKEKMLFLFSEYKEKINTDMPKIDKYTAYKDLDNLRIAYHSLASASLVFGMVNFAKLCRKIEEMILEGKNIDELKDFIEESKMLLKTDKKQVEMYLEK
ncbi:MAG: Hpt domain-containing protein [Lactobacillaceae bacterium]|jgi:HPt (histidine-containing phosphotransfer) domain-containing protein|nr:Hpt domain-containing protein [Lactobacillaceae bacterium]